MFSRAIHAMAAATEEVSAHCDGPCGVYDPASARIAAESAYSMTKKILALKAPEAGDSEAMAKYTNTVARYVYIKEQQAELCKRDLLILWTDFHKPAHLEKHPNLHDIYWKATKTCSYVKQEVSMQHAEELMEYCKQIHEMFWGSLKGRDVSYYTALNL